MMLQDGPLDGESQIVENLPTDPGDTLVFNIPSFQTFDPQAEAETVIGLGLQATYSFVGPGPGPGSSDTWTNSWTFEFTGEAFIPTPAPLPPPPAQPAVAVSQVWMVATTTLVPDSQPIVITPGMIAVAESGMEIDADVIPTQWGVVAMTGETVMVVTPDWTPKVAMAATASLWVDPAKVAMSAITSMEVNPS